MDVISAKEQVKEAVIKNLLLAHERIAKEGNTKENIRLSKYVLRLTQNGQDKILQLRPEEQECRREVKKVEIVINIPELKRVQELTKRNEELLSELYANLMEINRVSIKLAEKENAAAKGGDVTESF